MRLFVAILLSEEMKNALCRAQKDMQERNIRGSFSSEENLHLTLAFIGEYPDAERVLDALRGVDFAPFALGLEGLGRFGELWWAGLEQSAALEALARRVRRALAEAGIPYDRKRFSPHITLLRRACGDAAGVRVPAASMRVERFCLMRSDRGKSGMRYTELGAVEASE